MQNIWARKNNKPLLILAPMAGYTDSAFRQLCRSYGADIVMTELVSADAIAYGKLCISYHVSSIRAEGKNRNTAELLSFNNAERPLVVQLFGKYPEKFAKAAKWISEELKPDGIDINMGCPARKVVGSDHGAALLKNHNLAVEIVEAVKENTNLPVSVKTRLGWSEDDEILEFAPKLIDAGINAIMIHGRTYKDGFKGKARWQNVYKVKSEILNPKNVAIIGNGDIMSYQEAIDRADNGPVMLDGVAIGRAVFGKPWIFNDKFQMSNVKLKDIIMHHALLAYESKGERGIIELRKHLLAYIKGFSGAKELRKELVTVINVTQIEEILSRIK